MAIRSVAAGATWWDVIASKEIQAAFEISDSSPESNNTASDLPPLTKREQEILALMAKGQSNQEIADALYISPGTVRVHVHAILQKLDVRDRTQAVILAMQNGMLNS
ncbi:hypothetical protein B9T16_04095 [Arthrospira sp. PCC 8006]